MKHGRSMMAAALVALAACTAFKESGTTDPVDAGARDTGAPVVPKDADASGADGVAAADRKWRYVFVTSATRRGTFGPDAAVPGLQKADELCRDSAEAGDAKLHGRAWVAWLSTTTEHARDRVGAGVQPLTREYRLLSGTVIFSIGSSFEDGAASDVKLDENGKIPLEQQVWTGTSNTGERAAERCGDWTNDGAMGRIGVFDDRDGWSDVGQTRTCNNQRHVYCFEAP